MKIALLYAYNIKGVENYIIACEKKNIDYVPINILSNNWLEEVIDSKADIFVNRPHGTYEHIKTVFDERLYIISKVLNKPLFPSYEEVKIYENKRFLSDFLKANNIPHAKTDVFYNHKDAKDFIGKSEYPIVAKTNIGAAGSGIKIIRSRKEADKYIKKAFGKKGITVRFGPNRNKGNCATWSSKAIKSPTYFINKLKSYISRGRFGQRGYVIFQEYLEHDFEWRITKCGEYYYGYQKMKNGDMCSGCGISGGHEVPPEKLMNFVRDLCLKYNFSSMVVDILSTPDGIYRINELQTHWGIDEDDYMIMDGKRGVYIYDQKWKFIQGEFWNNNYFDTRLEVAIDLYKKGML